LAASVRQVLSGTDDGQSDIVRRIGQPPGAPGWFTPDDAIWTVHGSVATFLGGIRSLLMQALHPLALAGVDRHSAYRDDPLGRLQRTGAFIAATTFGSAELAESTVAAIGRMHDRVNGTTGDGRRYSARDPRLLEWVHVALVDSMLTAYLEFGHAGVISADGYVADMARVGAAMGVVDPPTTHAALTSRIAGFRGELAVGDDARQMWDFVMSAPLPLVLRPGYAVLAAWPAGARPARAGSRFGLADAVCRARPLARSGGRGTSAGVLTPAGGPMSVVLTILAGAAVVVAVAGLAGFVVSRTVVRGNAQKAAVVLGPPAPGDIDESAAQLAPHRAFGMLRLSSDRLSFAEGNGDVTTIPLHELVATSTTEPGSAGRLKRPCLVVAQPADGAAWAFAVADPDEWVRRLS
jgi:uncharacterized protein (DUF2236 family)